MDTGDDVSVRHPPRDCRERGGAAVMPNALPDRVAQGQSSPQRQHSPRRQEREVVNVPAREKLSCRRSWFY